MMTYEVDSIRATAQRLKSEGINISEAALRRWVKEGLLPAAYSGRRAYIRYSAVLELLEKGMPVPQPPLPEESLTKLDLHPVPGIRRIS